jgi:DNA processing protein
MTLSRQLTDQERVSWLRLSRTENIGPVTFRQLLQRYGTASAAIAVLPELSRKGGRNQPIRPYGQVEAETEIAKAQNLNAFFVTAGERGYPDYLRHIHAAPPLLCVKGNLDFAKLDAVAIVGARTASANGQKFTRMVASNIANAGLLVVSGLARGIDTAAHEASLDQQTCAVVAGGIDHIYPPENEKLQRSIGERGLLISEMPPGTAPKAEHFPRRNRIISGMSRAVVVIEAAMRSGSLITARLAAEQGRDVFAAPGSPLDPRCEGSNKLIRDGAQILTSADDVVEVLGMAQRPQNEIFLEREETELPRPDTEVGDSQRAIVMTLLSYTPTDVDDLIRESKLEPAQVMAILLEAEIAGRVSRTGGSTVALAS